MPSNTQQWFQYAVISYLAGVPLGLLLGTVFGLVFRIRRLLTHDRGLLDV